MHQENPYSPLSENETQHVEPYVCSKRARYRLASLIGVHLLATAYFAPVYWELVQVGATAFLSLVLSVAGCLCLYISTLTALGTRPLGKVGFILAALLVGISSSGWGWGKLWTIPFVAGSGLGLAGFWLVLQAQRWSKNTQA
ncbi:hypothetical protein RF679_01210 [Undibacterium cyanobacteriorum]|uniref:MerC domain-containing protein n=1 Tax=Undibacterium cyanobacteriorum TaxID=3073561 RepID=A0ABY9RI88_9BURK|nr:hypothetical protein [Undibacterium sp. 20NA77.5]WMW80915.1 hypothetical protein RF679_01210 [Undibacterium sp. 20NA77.5]